MIAVDTNILVYAHLRSFPLHLQAKELVRSLAEGSEPWGISYHSLVEFMATATSMRLAHHASPPEVAVRQVQLWTGSPSLNVLHDSPSSLRIFLDLIERTNWIGPRLHDLRIAATCLDSGVSEFLSTDRDFRQFAAIKCGNPFL